MKLEEAFAKYGDETMLRRKSFSEMFAKKYSQTLGDKTVKEMLNRKNLASGVFAIRYLKFMNQLMEDFNADDWEVVDEVKP